MSTRISVLLSLLCASAPVWAQDAPPAEPTALSSAEEAAQLAVAAVSSSTLVNGREDKAARESYLGTADRFTARMTEFEEDARSWVRFRESEERAALDQNYTALIDELDEDDRALRATAARRFEAFLDKYPNADHSAHVMFRLAELYFEDAEEDYLVADAEFQRAMDDIDAMASGEFPEEPKKDYRRSARLYRRIIENHPDYEYVDGCYYMLGFVQSQQASTLFDEAAGLQSFRELVERFPKSQFAAYAHLRIGEYYFDENNLTAAIPEYEKVIELEGPEGSLYDKGLYKLAWSEYKQNNYDRGLTLLNQLLDWSEGFKLRTGRESAVVPEAIEYIAISFSDVADNNGEHPLDVAKRFYAGIGERDAELKVYKRLADVLTQQARYEYAIDIYDYLQQRWPYDAENPDFLWKTASLHLSKVPGDREASRAAITRLSQQYGEGSDWWRANRNNPEAQSVARGYIEQSLAGVAVSFHDAANESQNPSDFGKAAEFYREYLTKFPFAEDYYEMQWYLAETLLRSGALDNAEKEYAQLEKGSKEHFYGEASRWWLRYIVFNRVTQQYGKVQTLPPDAKLEKKVELESGGERAVYALSPLHQSFIESSDTLLATDFDAVFQRIDDELAETTDRDAVEALKRDRGYLQPIASVAKQSRSGIAYQNGQVLYAHGRYEEARPRFEAVIEETPCTEEAAFSARLIVDSYTEEQDWSNVRQYAALYASKPLGASCGAVDIADSEFTPIVQKARLREIEALVAADKREEAAEAYLAFIGDFPNADPEILKNALYNAANNFDRVGRLDDSIRLFKQYVELYPEDELSRPLFFRLADTYARALELGEAVRYYERLYDLTNGSGKPYGDAPAALFNAGFLRIGMGDFEGAARTFEGYEAENSGEPDAEQVLFMAAEQWGRVSEQRELSFLRSYLKKYPAKNPDHVIEAYARIAELLEARGKARDTDKAYADLSAAYDQFAPTGRVGPAGRKYAAKAKLRDVMAQLDDFVAVPSWFTTNEAKAATLLAQKKDELPLIEREAGELVAKYKDFESSSAALYALGKAYLEYADMLYDAPVPNDFAADPDLEMIYFEELDKLRIPLEDKGRKRLEAVIQTAQSEKAWSEWQTLTLEELGRRFPAEFAPEKAEFRGSIRDTYVPTAGAAMPPEPEEPEGEGDSAPPPEQAPAPSPQETP